MTGTADLTFEPIPGLVATYDVCDANRTVLGVIAETGENDWRVLSVRYGAPEPARGPYPTRDAAAAALNPMESSP